MSSRARIHSRRQGVSLLEVMFSIGVAFVGLLGVTALIPVAVHYMGRGITADKVAAFGRSAISEFDIRHMHNPQMWLMPVGQNAFVSFQTDPALTLPDPNTPAPWRPYVGNAQMARAASFCIDPLFVSKVVPDLAGWSVGQQPPVDMFPAVEITTPVTEARMARVTLRIAPGPTFGFMGSLQAEDIFYLTDDLVFDRPRDRTLPPIPEMGMGAKRQFDGTLSWLATLTPVLLPASPASQQDLYTLSIVVLERRKLDATEGNERLVNVVDFGGGGEAGGDMTFAKRLPVSPDSDLELRAGDWVMLSGRLANGTSLFRWYRIAAADPDIQGGQRAVFLHGADWPAALVSQTQATIISGVVAVFEKTIRLEGASLWSN